MNLWCLPPLFREKKRFNWQFGKEKSLSLKKTNPLKCTKYKKNSKRSWSWNVTEASLPWQKETQNPLRTKGEKSWVGSECNISSPMLCEVPIHPFATSSQIVLSLPGQNSLWPTCAQHSSQGETSIPQWTRGNFVLAQQLFLGKAEIRLWPNKIMKCSCLVDLVALWEARQNAPFWLPILFSLICETSLLIFISGKTISRVNFFCRITGIISHRTKTDLDILARFMLRFFPVRFATSLPQFPAGSVCLFCVPSVTRSSLSWLKPPLNRVRHKRIGSGFCHRLCQLMCHPRQRILHAIARFFLFNCESRITSGLECPDIFCLVRKKQQKSRFSSIGFFQGSLPGRSAVGERRKRKESEANATTERGGIRKIKTRTYLSGCFRSCFLNCRTETSNWCADNWTSFLEIHKREKKLCKPKNLTLMCFDLVSGEETRRFLAPEALYRWVPLHSVVDNPNSWLIQSPMEM